MLMMPNLMLPQSLVILLSDYFKEVSSEGVVIECSCHSVDLGIADLSELCHIWQEKM